IFEPDGKVKYQFKDRDPSDVLWEEKVREDSLRDAGHQFVRATHHQLTAAPGTVVARLQTAFGRSLHRPAYRRRPVSPHPPRPEPCGRTRPSEGRRPPAAPSPPRACQPPAAPATPLWADRGRYGTSSRSGEGTSARGGGQLPLAARPRMRSRFLASNSTL